MRSTFYSLIVIALLPFLMETATVYAQSTASLVEKQYAPTPQSLEQVRYGTLPVDLYSGTVSFDIPVGSYTDSDFDIPVTLHYNNDGLRPLSPSGNAGLGWNLIAGGCISHARKETVLHLSK